jgi:hypothetical protein
MNDPEQLVEEINRASVMSFKGNFAVCKTTSENMFKLIEHGIPIYKVQENEALFGYTRPIAGTVFTSLSRSQALHWFNSLVESSEIQPDISEDECEVYELSQTQWDKLKEIALGATVPKDSDVDWLSEAGLVDYLESGNPQATSLGKDWVSLAKN